jgi:short-subunit dehydrogenase
VHRAADGHRSCSNGVLADTNVFVQLVLPAPTATEIWDEADIGMKALDPATIMTAEDCADAAFSDFSTTWGICCSLKS